MASDETGVPTARQPSQSPMTGTTSPMALQPPATTAATMVNRDRRAASSPPSWLRSNRPDTARSARSPLVVRTVSGRPPLANRERPGASIGAATRPQQHDPNISQHESEPPAAAHPVVTPPAPPPASLEPSVAGATKRKAPVEALGRDDRHDWRLPGNDATKGVYRRGAGGAGVQASGGGIMRITEEEGMMIMMGSRAMKNPARRVTTSGGETHGKRTRRAAATSDDGKSSSSSLRTHIQGS